MQGLSPSLPQLPPGPLSLLTPGLEWKETVHYAKRFRAAWIPADREADFVAGEGARSLTRFVAIRSDCKTARGKWKKKVYWCSYGPSDLRNRSEQEELVSEGAPKKRRRKDPSCKRGCQAHFEVMEYIAQPDRIQIWLRKEEHVDSQGLVCHGPDCPEAGRHTSAPCISDEKRDWVRRCLAAGLQGRQIVQHNLLKFHLEYMKRHSLPSLKAAQEMLQTQDRGKPRDYLMDFKDVYNIGRRLAKVQWHFEHDQIEVMKQVALHVLPEHILLLKEGSGSREDGVLLWSSPEMQEAAAHFGHNAPLLLHDTSDAVHSQVLLQSILVCNEKGVAVPVAWFAAQKLSREGAQECLAAFIRHCSVIKPGFRPSCFVTDAVYAMHLAMRMAMPGAQVLISTAATRAAWETAASQMSDERCREETLQKLDTMLRFRAASFPHHSREQLQEGVRDELERLCSGIADQADFCAMLQKDWIPNIDMWCPMLYDGKSEAAMRAECLDPYVKLVKEQVLHTKQKLNLLPLHYLVHKLLSGLEIYDVENSAPRNTYRSTYRRALERMIGTTASKALAIADDMVHLPSEGNETATVLAQGQLYHVVLPGTASASCTCSYSMRGEVCQHTMKVAMMIDPRITADSFILYLAKLAAPQEGGMTGLYANFKPPPESRPSRRGQEQATSEQHPSAHDSSEPGSIQPALAVPGATTIPVAANDGPQTEPEAAQPNTEAAVTPPVAVPTAQFSALLQSSLAVQRPSSSAVQSVGRESSTAPAQQEASPAEQPAPARTSVETASGSRLAVGSEGTVSAQRPADASRVAVGAISNPLMALLPQRTLRGESARPATEASIAAAASFTPPQSILHPAALPQQPGTVPAAQQTALTFKARAKEELSALKHDIDRLSNFLSPSDLCWLQIETACAQFRSVLAEIRKHGRTHAYALSSRGQQPSSTAPSDRPQAA